MHFFDIESSKSGPDPRCFVHFDLGTCASRHNGVQFFDISSSNSALEMGCIVDFDLQMCFTPQWRALFQHLNFQNWSETNVFCNFLLPNVLRTTMACTFSTSQLPKVVRTWCVLYILTSTCASRHIGVHFLDISTSKSGPELRRFVPFDFHICFARQLRTIFHLSSGQLASIFPQVTERQFEL